MTTAGARGEGAGQTDLAGWSARLRPRARVEGWSERLRPRSGRIARHPLGKSTKRHTVRFSKKAKRTSRTSKLVAVKRKVNKDDEADYLKHEHDKVESLNLEDDEADSWKRDYPPSPEYDPGLTSTWMDRYPPCSPSTKQKEVEYTRTQHLIRARKALDYYHTKYPDNQHKPVHVNLKHVIFIIERTGHYIHMNFTAVNQKTGDEKLFFAEFFLSYDGDYSQGFIATACVIVGSDSLGGLRHKFDPDTKILYGDEMDLKHCYACDDFVKHPEGSTYQAGHRGHMAYEVCDISDE